MFLVSRIGGVTKIIIYTKYKEDHLHSPHLMGRTDVNLERLTNFTGVYSTCGVAQILIYPKYKEDHLHSPGGSDTISKIPFLRTWGTILKD